VSATRRVGTLLCAGRRHPFHPGLAEGYDHLFAEPGQLPLEFSPGGRATPVPSAAAGPACTHAPISFRARSALHQATISLAALRGAEGRHPLQPGDPLWHHGAGYQECQLPGQQHDLRGAEAVPTAEGHLEAASTQADLDLRTLAHTDPDAWQHLNALADCHSVADRRASKPDTAGHPAAAYGRAHSAPDTSTADGRADSPTDASAADGCADSPADIPAATTHRATHACAAATPHS